MGVTSTYPLGERRHNVSSNLPHAVDTMRTQPAQIQTESADQNRTTRELIAARTP